MVTLPHQQRNYQLFGTPGFFPCILSIFHCFPGHLEVYPLFGLSENDGNYSKIPWTMIFKLTFKTDPHFQRTEVGDGWLSQKKNHEIPPRFHNLKNTYIGLSDSILSRKSCHSHESQAGLSNPFTTASAQPRSWDEVVHSDESKFGPTGSGSKRQKWCE